MSLEKELRELREEVKRLREVVEQRSAPLYPVIPLPTMPVFPQYQPPWWEWRPPYEITYAARPPATTGTTIVVGQK